MPNWRQGHRRLCCASKPFTSSLRYRMLDVSLMTRRHDHATLLAIGWHLMCK